MKHVILLIVLVVFGKSGLGQMEVQLQAGVSGSRLNFPGFETYLESYNQLNSGSELLAPAKFNPYGIGYQVGGMFRMGWFVTGITMGHIAGFQSKATFVYDQSRSFQFKNTYFDLQLGGRIGGEKLAFIPYVGMSINSLNLHTFFTYGDVKSYGGEKGLNGVYTSWRLVGIAGGRLEYRFTNTVGVFIDAGFMLNKSEYSGGDFSESNSATDSKYFQSTASQDQTDAIVNGLKEVYRISRGVFGLQVTFGSNEKE